MNATKENLIEICEELYDKNMIWSVGFGDKYDICNGFVRIDIKSRNPKTWSKIWKNFEKLGYTLDWKDTGTGMYIVEIHKDINK